MVTFRDLSERQLRDGQLAELLDSFSLAVAAYDLDGDVTFAAGGGFRVAGIDPSVAFGVSLLRTSPVGAAVQDAVQDSLRGRTRDFGVSFGDRQWRCHAAPVLESGLLTGGFVVGLDVTEQQQSQDRLADTLGAAQLCLVCFDVDGVITYAAGSGYRDSSVEAASTKRFRLPCAKGSSTTRRAPELPRPQCRAAPGAHATLMRLVRVCRLSSRPRAPGSCPSRRDGRRTDP